MLLPNSGYASDTVLHQYISDSSVPDESLESLLYLSSSVELIKAGLTSTRVSNEEKYLLVANYAKSDDFVEIQLQFLTAGGGAPLIIAPDMDRAKMKISPYLNAGLALRFMQMRNTFLDLDLGYQSIFESDVIIMSFVPALKIVFEI